MPWRCSACGGENPDGTRFCGHCGGAHAEDPAREATVAEALKSFVSAQVAERIAAGTDRREERRLVTALFADLSGFTPLADRLDPEQLLEVIDPIIERLTNIVGRYEGYVDKFAGDALLAFFGAPVAHEDDAYRALVVASEMHHELAGLARSLPPEAGELTLHIGVNTGHVVARVIGTDVRMDYAVLGDAVILAQRLESAAPAGDTYVGEATYQLTRDRFDFESVGELTLKGKAEAVPAWRLLGRHRRTRPLASLVGRKQEIDRVTAAMDTFETGRGLVVSISGEPGVGKSRFTAEIQEIADERGYRWLSAPCIAYGAGIAYWPYAETIRMMAGISPRDDAERALPRLNAILDALGVAPSAPLFARMLGLPAPEIEAFEPESYRRELLAVIGDMFKSLSRERPTILAIEDLHWADPSSIALTSELARLTDDHAIGIYVTARREAVGALLDVAAGTDEARRHALQLDPLDAPATGPILEELLSAPCSPEVIEAINERAVGNPFFATELASSLVEAGGLVRDNGAWTLAPGFDLEAIPPTIEGVLASRLDNLSPGAASTLQVCSVIGRRVLIPLLHGVSDDPTVVDGQLKELLDVGLLDVVDPETAMVRPHQLVFHHALVQDVAYARLLRKDRRALHLRVAEVAEDLYGANDDTIDLLARHLHLAEAGSKAVDYLVRAGYRASGMFANDEALIHLEHALDLTVKHAPERRGAIVLKIADLYELRGDYATALARYTEARDLTSSVLAWRGMASSHRNLADYEAALTVVSEGLRATKDPDSAHLWLEQGWVLSRQGRFDDAIEAFSRGLSAAGAAFDSVVGHLRLQLARAEMITGALDSAQGSAESAAQMFEQLGDRRGSTTALRILGDLYRTSGRLDDAAGALEEALDLARQTGNAEEQAATMINLGIVEMERKNLEIAIGHDHAAIEQFARIGIATGQAIGFGNLAEKLLVAGRPEEALKASARALDLARSIGDLETVADVTKTVAAVRLAQGNGAEAGASAEEAAELYLEMDARPYARKALELAARGWLEAGDEERARSVSERARELATAKDQL